MTIKLSVLLLAACSQLFVGCKTAKKAETSDTKVAISIPAQRIDKDQLQELIKMIQTEAKAAETTKPSSSRGIPVADTFRFFNLTDEEMNRVKGSRKKPTTVEKFTNGGVTYYLLSSIGESVKTPVQSTGGYTVEFASNVNLYVQILAADKLDICRMEGIKIYTYLIPNRLVGFFGDGSPNAQPSQVVTAPSSVYPRSDCIKR